MANDRWLKKLDNGIIFNWTKELCKRDDMIECDKTGRPLAFDEKADLHTFIRQIEVLSRENETLKLKLVQATENLKTIEELRFECDRLKMKLAEKDMLAQPEIGLKPGEATVESLDGTTTFIPEDVKVAPAMQPADDKVPMPKYEGKMISNLSNEKMILAAKEIFGLELDKSIGRLELLKAISDAHKAKTAKG
jgi:hypothetical protein